MGKAERNRREGARERIAAQQAAARRAERRRQALIAGGSVLLVIAIAVVFIVVKAVRSSTAGRTDIADAEAIPAVAQQVASVPASTLDAVGRGGASSMIPVSGAPALTADGKPEMVYMGAEYCPYCAAERWALAVALSRFGTFSNLHFTRSSSTDVYKNTPTLTFYKSRYSSKYLVFNPVELYTNKPDSGSPAGYTTLQTPTAAESALMRKYDAPPYVPSSGTGSFPFVDIGNKYLVVGAQYVPSSLAGLTWSQVASQIKNPSSAVAKDVDGAANTITAAICKVTGNNPASVCSSSAAQAGSGAL
jgi:thiol-disulfide isomerase/thioredoxin